MPSGAEEVANSLSKICEDLEERNLGEHVIKKKRDNMFCSMSNTDAREPACDNTASFLNVGCPIKKDHVYHTFVITVPVSFPLDFLNKRNGMLGNEPCILQTSCQTNEKS